MTVQESDCRKTGESHGKQLELIPVLDNDRRRCVKPCNRFTATKPSNPPPRSSIQGGLAPCLLTIRFRKNSDRSGEEVVAVVSSPHAWIGWAFLLTYMGVVLVGIRVDGFPTPFDIIKPSGRSSSLKAAATSCQLTLARPAAGRPHTHLYSIFYEVRPSSHTARSTSDTSASRTSTLRLITLSTAEPVIQSTLSGVCDAADMLFCSSFGHFGTASCRIGR